MQNLPLRLSRKDYFISLLIACVTFLIYRITLTPSLSYRSPDGNELATIPYVLGLAHMPGYPLYTWLGKIFTLLPVGDVAHRMNLMSATFGALGVAGFYLIVALLLHPKVASVAIRRAGASLAALCFAFSPTFWSQSVITEVYTPNIAMVALTILALLNWEHTRRDLDFFLFSVTFGLSLGMHISNLGFAPAFVFFIFITDRSILKRPTWWLAALIGFGLGIAQFIWLPLKASTLNDRLMLEHAPTTLKGIFDYTLGAFPQLKFAFRLGELPDRVVVYLYLLGQEFGWASIFLGLFGLTSLLLRRPRYYHLLVWMYLTHVWFFIQYRAFDLDVFFLPAHFLWAIFLAFAIVEVLGCLENLISKVSNALARKAGRWALATLTLLFSLIPILKNFEANDHSSDVAINDFYANVWEVLPNESALLTQGGVFGYDAFYWQLVYNTRPDVLLPALPTPNPTLVDLQGRDLYTTTSLTGFKRARGPGALPTDLVSTQLWHIPLLVGVQTEVGINPRGRLMLYHLSDRVPDLVIDDASPATEFEVDLGDLTLIGAEIETMKVESGGRIHLTLFWRIQQLKRYQVGITLGDQVLETHELGFGNLERFQAEVGPLIGKAIVEDYWLVIPSTTPVGRYPLRVQAAGGDQAVEIGVIEVIDQEEVMERWMRIAG